LLKEIDKEAAKKRLLVVTILTKLAGPLTPNLRRGESEPSNLWGCCTSEEKKNIEGLMS